ncbi:hypothetical protein DITRI_Ditri01bG0006100 [Diplodiscus trichospermus]
MAQLSPHSLREKGEAQLIQNPASLAGESLPFYSVLRLSYLVADEEGLPEHFFINVMDLENKKFGRGPKELGGAADLINHFKLWPHHEFFCKRSLPLSISETSYLRNVVGDTEIRKGEGMELNQLFHNSSDLTWRNLNIGPFDLGFLAEAFHMSETVLVDLPLAEKGIPTMVSKSRAEPKYKKRKHRKQKDKDKEKDKNRKHKHHHKDMSTDKHKIKISQRHYDSGPEHLKKPQGKKMRYAGNGDLFGAHRQQNDQHPRRVEMGRLKMAG